MRSAEGQVQECNGVTAEQSEVNAERSGVIAERSGVIVERCGVIVEWSGVITERSGVIVERAGVIAELGGVIVEQGEVIVEPSGVIAERGGLIVEWRGVITRVQCLQYFGSVLTVVCVEALHVCRVPRVPGQEPFPCSFRGCICDFIVIWEVKEDPSPSLATSLYKQWCAGAQFYGRLCAATQEAQVRRTTGRHRVAAQVLTLTRFQCLVPGGDMETEVAACRGGVELRLPFQPKPLRLGSLHLTSPHKRLGRCVHLPHLADLTEKENRAQSRTRDQPGSQKRSWQPRPGGAPEYSADPTGSSRLCVAPATPMDTSPYFQKSRAGSSWNPCCDEPVPG
ncbi:hypothetical protein AAY473_013739 [Plecturocebus cupreus]